MVLWYNYIFRQIVIDILSWAKSYIISSVFSEVECADECTTEEAVVCGDDGVTYHNECLLNYSACTNGINIKVDRKGPCPLMDKNEDKINEQSEALDTTGDDDDEDNSSEDEEILRDTEGKDFTILRLLCALYSHL